jgi:secreted trypsin-like serine protease
MMSLRRRRLTGLLLAAAALLPATAAAAEDARIVGGAKASRAYPHQALLKARRPAEGGGEWVGRCGGSLVAARYIVTAAHCLSVEGASPATIEVTLGSADVAGTAPNFQAVQWWSHPQYGTRPGDGYDVALIQLNKAADHEQLRLLRPADTAMWSPGTTATLIGWGWTDDQADKGFQSDQLLEVQVPIYSDGGCTSDFQAARAPADFFVPLTMVCAGGKDGKDSCSGDSGGPLLVPDGARFAMAGIVSFGAAFQDANGNVYSCAEGVPGVYSRVAADPLNNWVRSMIPQVEIDASPAQPEPGQPVALTAAGSVAYEKYEWDLDNDGTFGDVTGPTASYTPELGTRTIAVRATRGSGDQRDQETRRIDIEARYRSPVAFAAPAITVTEGRPVAIAVNKTGGGTGAFTITPSSGTAMIGNVDAQITSALTLGFTGEQLTQTVTIPTVDDRLVEPPETFTLDLGGHTGGLVPGTPTNLIVTIADNDVTPKITAFTSTAKRKRGKVTLKYRINTGATVRLGITDPRGRVVYASMRKRHAKAGTYSTTVKLKRSATAKLRRARTLKARAIYAIMEGDDLIDSRIRKLSIKR